MDVLLNNFASAELESAISETDTVLQVRPGEGVQFPAPVGSEFVILVLEDETLTKEVVQMTNRSADTLTVVRAQEGTTATAYPIGTRVEIRLTAGFFDAYGDGLIADHEASIDPHPQYLTVQEANENYDTKGDAQQVQDNLDIHINTTNIHFPDAVADGVVYGRLDNEWVEVTVNPPANPGGIIYSDTTPVDGERGDLWLKTNTGRFYVFYPDGTSDQWIEVGPGVIVSGSVPQTVAAGTQGTLPGPTPAAIDPANVIGPEAITGNTFLLSGFPTDTSRVELYFWDVGVSSSAVPSMQLEIDNTAIVTGYQGSAVWLDASSVVQAWGSTQAKWVPDAQASNTRSYNGKMTLTFIGISNRWSIEFALADTAGGLGVMQSIGFLTATAGQLTGLRFNVAGGGGDVFDAGFLEAFAYNT